VFTTSESFQRTHQTLAFCLQLRDRKKAKLNKLGKALAEIGPVVRDLGLDADRKTRPRAAYAGRLFARGEQTPNPDSRVTLVDETDRLGLRKVRLDWQLSDADRRSIRLSMEAFARRFGGSGIGRVRVRMDDPDTWPATRGGDHHLGTTRMAADPAQGVVDAQCKVHGLANLYLAGSSVFATSGFANPTFTITALALRLAHHLEGLA
jgi:choline dehydrogenase-like flavoprotein